jgi:FkbM family methyltransferase
VLDAGAHIGTFALGATALGCEVAAVEASPANVFLLRRGVQRNGFERLAVIAAALGERSAQAWFEERGAWGGVARDPDERSGLLVPVLSGEDVLRALRWEHVDVIKIDVEGSEIPVLRGLAPLLRREPGPLLVCELNRHCVDPHALKSLLASFGYQLHLIYAGRLVPARVDELEVNTVCDLLCTRREHDWDALLARLPGWRVGPLSDAEIVDLVLTDAQNEVLRPTLSGVISRLPQAVRSDPRIEQLAAELGGSSAGRRGSPSPEPVARA